MKKGDKMILNKDNKKVWIEKHGSERLRRACDNGFKCQMLYEIERETNSENTLHLELSRIKHSLPPAPKEQRWIIDSCNPGMCIVYFILKDKNGKLDEESLIRRKYIDENGLILRKHLDEGGNIYGNCSSTVQKYLLEKLI